MTANDRFGRTLESWLHEDAEHRVPGHLGEVLVRTAATRQRPWWSSPERWLSMDTVANGRGQSLRPLLILAVIGLLLAASVGLALFVGAGRTPTTPLGSAENGQILVIDGGSVRSYAPDGTGGRTLLDVPDGATYLAASPDGRRLAVAIGEDAPRVEVIDIADGTTTTIRPTAPFMAGDQLAWSPTGDRLVMPGFAGDREAVLVASVDDGTLDVVGDINLGIWWPTFSPDGERIAFVGVDKATGQSAIHVMAPDGSGHDVLDTVDLGADPGLVSWSPDPSTDRILYTVAKGSDLFVQVMDVETGAVTDLGQGFWPTWSPDGSRIAYWHDGTVVVETAAALAGTAEPLRVTPAFTSTCQDHAELAGQSFCGIAHWSPDGTRLFALDIVGSSVLSVMADGSGEPMVIPLESASPTWRTLAAWQPIRR